MNVFLLFTSLIFLVGTIDAHAQICLGKTVKARYTGNLVSNLRYEGVSNPEKALGPPDYTLLNISQAEFSNGGKAVYDLQRYIPGGKTITVHLVVSIGDRMLVTSSTDDITYTGDFIMQNDMALLNTPLQFDYTTPPGGARFICFESASGIISLDGITYDITTCLTDTDGDGVADIADRDDDNDGLDDLSETSYFTDPSKDSDMDGRADYMDPDFAGFTDSNGDGVDNGADHDLDGIPNHLDLDTDNDALPDALEANGGMLTDNFTAEGQLTDTYIARNDTDGDGMADRLAAARLMAQDTDGDGIPDYKDMDTDNDGLTDVREAGGKDADGDGYVDAFIDSDNDGLANAYDPDSGGKRVALTDTDGDILPDYLDGDADNDGVLDKVEAHDKNADGKADWDIDNNQVLGLSEGGEDANNNGLADIFDPQAGAAAVSAQDTDSDGMPDYIDRDDDNDGIATAAEDVDNNGIFYDDFTGGQIGKSASTPDYLHNNFLGIPVTLLSFAGELVLTTVKLDWVTATEQDNSHFEVERAGPDYQFSTIGMVDSKGDNGIQQSYTFTDNLPTYGPNYYRLKQVDLSGLTQYTDVILVEAKLPLPDMVMTVFPNPLGPYDDLTIDLKNLDSTKPVEVVIVDLSGQVVFQETYDPASGRTLSILRNRMPGRDGMYMVRATNGDQELTEQLYLSSIF